MSVNLILEAELLSLKHYCTRRLSSQLGVMFAFMNLKVLRCPNTKNAPKIRIRNMHIFNPRIDEPGDSRIFKNRWTSFQAEGILLCSRNLKTKTMTTRIRRTALCISSS